MSEGFTFADRSALRSVYIRDRQEAGTRGLDFASADRTFNYGQETFSDRIYNYRTGSQEKKDTNGGGVKVRDATDRGLGIGEGGAALGLARWLVNGNDAVSMASN
ncbi:hypothetical protein CC2G_006432 [Coprinopsis cinerea AmutBmut pab1-1]|nr:hypothetical protein CC2G_006432 [Coprinopsis cinerea AmutBmut pab1-1]